MHWILLSWAHLSSFPTLQFLRNEVHLQFEQKIGQFSTEKAMLYTIFTSFQANFSHVIVEMIARPKVEGSQS